MKTLQRKFIVKNSFKNIGPLEKKLVSKKFVTFCGMSLSSRSFVTTFSLLL